jgi:hypothetical protein
MRSTIVMTALLASATSQARTPSAVDPKAVDALDCMGAFLRAQQSFTVHLATDTDYVLDSGQKVRLGETGQISVRRPNKLHAEVVSPRKERSFFYDGKTFTMWGPRVAMYAAVPAEPTLKDTADMLEDRYGLELPMVDIFRWGTDEDSTNELTAATYVGKATIDGVETDQYAFRQPGLDWQIWIQRGSQPLPRKIVLTTTDDQARPERAINMTWQLNVQHPDSEFVFTPPKTAQKITLAEKSEDNNVNTSQRDRAARRPAGRQH